MDQELIGHRIARHRKAAGISAQELSGLLDGLMSREMLANVESGRRIDITVGQLIAISRVLDIAPASLAIPAGNDEDAEWFCDFPSWYRPLRVREAAALVRDGLRADMSESERNRYEKAINLLVDGATWSD